MLRRLSKADGLFLEVGDEMRVGFLMAARVRGAFSLQELRSALRKARRRHPLLAVRAARDDEDQPWLTTQGVPDLPVRVVEGVGEDRWLAEAHVSLVAPFSASTGPLVRFAWLRPGDQAEASYLLAVCHHGIADGNSGAFLLRDVIHYLGHPDAEVERLPLQPELLDLIPPDVVERRVEHMKAQFSGSPRVSMEELRERGPMSEMWSLSPPRFCLRAWSLSSGQTSTLVARCREERTTVHGALGTSFLRAFGQALQASGEEWVRNLQSPVSLRNRLTAPIGDDMGVYMSHLLTTVNCSPERCFWDVAREIRTSMLDQFETEDLFTRTVMTRVIGEMISEQQGLPRHLVEDPSQMVNYDLSLSNLGRLDFPTQYGALRLEALFGPAFAAMPRDKIVGVTTFDGCMNLMFICRENTMEASVVDQVIEGAMDLLTSAIA